MGAQSHSVKVKNTKNTEKGGRETHIPLNIIDYISLYKGVEYLTDSSRNFFEILNKWLWDSK